MVTIWWYTPCEHLSARCAYVWLFHHSWLCALLRSSKPNENKSASEFNAASISNQLRVSGVLEAVRISRAGFPDRMAIADVAARFGLLSRRGATTAIACVADTVAGLLSYCVPTDGSIVHDGLGARALLVPDCSHVNRPRYSRFQRR